MMNTGDQCNSWSPIYFKNVYFSTNLHMLILGGDAIFLFVHYRNSPL